MSDPIYIRVKVQPKSGRLEFNEQLEDGTYKIRLKAAPEKGKANEELIAFLAKSCALRKDELSLVSGHTERTKLIRLPAGTKLPW